MIATVAVRAYYQTHCPPCMASVEQTVSSAIRDLTVTSITLIAQKRCEHDALAAPLLGNRTQPESPTSRGKISPPTPPLAPESKSDPELFLVEDNPAHGTNGFDPNM